MVPRPPPGDPQNAESNSGSILLAYDTIIMDIRRFPKVIFFYIKINTTQSELKFFFDELPVYVSLIRDFNITLYVSG